MSEGLSFGNHDEVRVVFHGIQSGIDIRKQLRVVHLTAARGKQIQIVAGGLGLIGIDDAERDQVTRIQRIIIDINQ